MIRLAAALALLSGVGGDRIPAEPRDILGVALELAPQAFASAAYDRHFPGWSMSNYGYRQDRE
jgi:hypothetical protein